MVKVNGGNVVNKNANSIAMSVAYPRPYPYYPANGGVYLFGGWGD